MVGFLLLLPAVRRRRRRYRRCASLPLPRALFFLLFPLFRSPLQPVLTPFSLPLINLLGTPRPRLSRSSIPTCCCILRKPRSIPYQPVRRRVFFPVHAEKLSETWPAPYRRGGGKGVKESRFFFFSFPPCRVARFPMFIVDRVSLADRPRLHRQGKWIG